MAYARDEDGDLDRRTGSTVEMAGEKPSTSWLVDGGSSVAPAFRVVSEGETIVVGTGREADVRVFDGAVSARHCELSVREGQLTVRDLSSKNGVFVGGARVEQALLGAGASFVVGRSVLVCAHSSRIPVAEPDVAPLPGVVGASFAMRRLVREVRRLVDLKGPVLLRGETGVGKDVIARAMHTLGNRRARPFVALNVSTLPRDLADAELFGHERGAYTGAHGSREGAFAQAHGGTLFLDEIAELPFEQQVKLLRVLEDGEVRPLGGRGRKIVDVRVISATWAPLHRRVAEGLFRQDLYQRLAVFVIDVPSLRERRTDLPALANHFLRSLAEEVGQRELSSGALAKLAGYAWPGNVRELRNVLYRAALAAEGRVIGGGEIAQSLDVTSGSQKLAVSSEQARAVVTSHAGNVSAAARQLGVARSTLRDLLER
jgi:DNA-binding NtrC family response regulator